MGVIFLTDACLCESRKPITVKTRDTLPLEPLVELVETEIYYNSQYHGPRNLFFPVRIGNGKRIISTVEDTT